MLQELPSGAARPRSTEEFLAERLDKGCSPGSQQRQVQLERPLFSGKARNSPATHFPEGAILNPLPPPEEKGLRVDPGRT